MSVQIGPEIIKLLQEHKHRHAKHAAIDRPYTHMISLNDLRKQFGSDQTGSGNAKGKSSLEVGLASVQSHATSDTLIELLETPFHQCDVQLSKLGSWIKESDAQIPSMEDFISDLMFGENADFSVPQHESENVSTTPDETSPNKRQ